MAQSIKNRVFGSDVPNIIKKRIEARQLLARADRNPNDQIKPSAYPDDRATYYTYGELNEMNFGGVADLSSRTPFARMWTAVNVATDVLVKELDKESAIQWENEQDALKNPSDEYLKSVGETEADKRYEVHKWVDVNNSTKIYVLGNHILGTEQVGPNTPRTTGAGTVTAEVMKELLPFEQETDMNAFLKPPAGITSISSETEGPLGALKKTKVNFTVHNFHDFEKIYLRYFLKPGAQVFIDFGWDTGRLYDPKELLEIPENIEDRLYGDTGYVTISNGDMECLYGHVINYDAAIRDDGGFDCSVEIISKNASILSNSFDQKLKDRVKYGLDIEIMGLAVSGVLNDYTVYEKATKWGQATTTQDELRYAFAASTIKLLGGTTAPLPGMIDTKTSMAALKHGVFYAGTMEENMKLFVNYGWFEDNFLNKELAFSDSEEDLKNTSKDSGTNDEGKLLAKFSSKNSYISYNEKLKKAMMMRGFYEGSMFLYPASWGADGTTYNIEKNMVPDRFDEDGNIVDFSSVDSSAWADWEKKDREEDRIPLREIFLSVDSIKTTFDTAGTTSEFLKTIMANIKEASGGIISLGIQSNNYGQHTISFIDKNLLTEGSKVKSSPSGLSEFLEKLLVFSPYSPDTIVKSYDLSFKMPQDGLGNMLAIQSSNSTGGDQSINDLMDGLVKLNEMDTKGVYNDKFIRYVPSIGKEAGKRLTKTTTKESAGTFNFKDSDIAHGKGAAKIKQQNIQTGGQVGAPYSEYKDKLTENLDRALDEDTDLLGEDTTPEPEVEETPEDTKKSEEDIAKKQHQNLVATPYDFWIRGAVQSHTSTIAPILPIEISLKIYGISGLMPGDLIRVNYLPEKYYLNSYFQITKVSQTIGDTWDTSLTTIMRIAPMDRTTPEKKIIVGKSYLRNVLKLEEIDTYIHAFGNLLPIDIPNGKNGRLVYIDNIFECIAEGTLEKERRFSLPVQWSSKSEDELEAKPGGGFWDEWHAPPNSNGIPSPKIKFTTNWEASAILQDIFTDDVDYSGVEIEIDEFKKGCKYYIITSGKNWTIWNSMDIVKLDQINLVFSMTRGKEISKTLKDKSWKATGQELMSAAGEKLAPYGEKFGDAKEKVGDFIDDASETLEDAGEWIKDKFGGWW